MLKTFKQFRANLLLVPAMFLLFSNVFAQSIIFSSEQWPKRWERAMKNVSLNGHVAPPRQRERTRYRQGDIKQDFQMAAQQGGWGKPPERMRHDHKRSRTPEYHNGTHFRQDDDPLKRRYALPNTPRNLYGYGRYPDSYYGQGRYTTGFPAVPHLPAAIYPAPVYGGYPGAYPGMGVPGLYTAPGPYPFGGFPGVGYPW